jgi:protein-disulfide isomerase
MTTSLSRLLSVRALLFALGVLLMPAALEAQAARTESRGSMNMAIDTLGYVLGLESAPVEVVEFIDFGCSQCARFTRESFPVIYREFVLTGKVKWRTIPFVLGSFRHAALAAEAGECAAEQGRFLAMHDALLARQREWTASNAPQPLFAEIAKEAGADPRKYADCVRTERTRDRVRAQKDIALRLQIYGTPTFIVQRERRVLGAIPTDQFLAALRREVALSGR